MRPTMNLTPTGDNPRFKGLEQTFLLITDNCGTFLEERPGLKVSFKGGEENQVGTGKFNMQ